MSNKVYVGNLPYSFTSDDLRNLFAAFGPVRLAEVKVDRETNRSRGFGFVEMESGDAVQQVIRNLHDTELQGRRLTVNEARDREPGAPGAGPRSFSGPRPFAAPGQSSAPGRGGGSGGPRSSGPDGGGPRSGGTGGYGTPRSPGGGGGFSGGRGGGPQRGSGRPKRDEHDRWSDGGGGRRRRLDDDFGDE